MIAVAKVRETPILKFVPPVEESKKVSFDENYIKVPRELLRAVHRARFTEIEADVFWAIYEKVVGWYKETDRIVNEQICELSEREATKSNINMISEAKKRLVSRKIIIVDGKKLGVNLAVSEWVNPTKTGKKSIPVKMGEKSNSNLVFNPTLTGNTKDNKRSIKNNTPFTPQRGVSASENLGDEKILAQAKELLAYYNELANGSCRDATPFIALLTKTKGRDAYAMDDIKLVIRWVLSVWNRHNNRPAKPLNICRVKRFDGYLSDAMEWDRKPKLEPVNYSAVVEAYNAVVSDSGVDLPLVADTENLSDDRKKQIHEMAKIFHKRFGDYSANAFANYFRDFMVQANARDDKFYYGGLSGNSWKADFGYLMKPSTLDKTVENSL